MRTIIEQINDYHAFKTNGRIVVLNSGLVKKKKTEFTITIDVNYNVI